MCPAAVWPQSIIATLPVAGSQIAVNAITHKTYVANGSGTVTVVDGTTHAITTLEVGGSPSAIAVNPVTNMVYVANAPTNSVTVINGETNGLTTVTDPHAAAPSLVAVNATTNKIYVVNAGHAWGVPNVTVIDGASNATTTVDALYEGCATSSICHVTLAGIAINSATNEIYIAHSQSRDVGFPRIANWVCNGYTTVIDGASNDVTSVGIGTVQLGGGGPCAAYGIGVNSVTNEVFVAWQYGVAVVDGTTKALRAVIPGWASGVAVNSVTNKIYVLGSGGVGVMDGTTLSGPVVAASNPVAAAVDALRNMVYVSNGASGNCPGAFCNPGNVIVIDGSTDAATTLIDPHASGPGALAIDSSADRVYVANGFSNNLTVIAGNIAPTSHALAVIFSGAAGGTVASSPPGIDCGVTACAASFPVGSMVSLLATGSAASALGGWSGACSGSGACQITMNSDQFVTATFASLVPNVVGQTQAAATAAIASAGLMVGNVTQGYAKGVPLGNVISESPAAGTVVAAGSAVNLVVSGDVVVPNVVGQTQASASVAVTNAALSVGNVTQGPANGVAPGNVISESPAAGTVVAAGSAVNLLVSDDDVVPSVVGGTISAASLAINGRGLTIGTITQQSSTTVPSGNVISESPAAGSYVGPGSSVNLVVSTGPEELAVPNVVGQTQAAATTAITGAGLVVGTVAQQSSSTVASGDVISETPAAGKDVASGSAVNLVVSTGSVQLAVPNVVGQTQAAATTVITSAGLIVGTVTQQTNSSVASGDVVSETPAAGSAVASDSAVNLVVSSGDSTGGGSGGSGGGGGGGALDWLTVAALLSCLRSGLRTLRRT
jgi:beta-lactam-binding protein with PASTA domain